MMTRNAFAQLWLVCQLQPFVRWSDLVAMMHTLVIFSLECVNIFAVKKVAQNLHLAFPLEANGKEDNELYLASTITSFRGDPKHTSFIHSYCLFALVSCLEFY